jgi:hypothetical protein
MIRSSSAVHPGLMLLNGPNNVLVSVHGIEAFSLLGSLALELLDTLNDAGTDGAGLCHFLIRKIILGDLGIAGCGVTRGNGLLGRSGLGDTIFRRVFGALVGWLGDSRVVGVAFSKIIFIYGVRMLSGVGYGGSNRSADGKLAGSSRSACCTLAIVGSVGLPHCSNFGGAIIPL